MEKKIVKKLKLKKEIKEAMKDLFIDLLGVACMLSMIAFITLLYLLIY